VALAKYNREKGSIEEKARWLTDALFTKWVGTAKRRQLSAEIQWELNNAGKPAPQGGDGPLECFRMSDAEYMACYLSEKKVVPPVCAEKQTIAGAAKQRELIAECEKTEKTEGCSRAQIATEFKTELEKIKAHEIGQRKAIRTSLDQLIEFVDKNRGSGREIPPDLQKRFEEQYVFNRQFDANDRLGYLNILIGVKRCLKKADVPKPVPLGQTVERMERKEERAKKPEGHKALQQNPYFKRLLARKERCLQTLASEDLDEDVGMMWRYISARGEQARDLQQPFNEYLDSLQKRPKREDGQYVMARVQGLYFPPPGP
ncbi:MAG: hypothetical protein KGQ49_01630, partial [Verrucomicrobia bacterium]|nr:hypothetical protein [Verrucomicrobiota bacterium]